MNVEQLAHVLWNLLGGCVTIQHAVMRCQCVRFMAIADKQNVVCCGTILQHGRFLQYLFMGG